MNGSGQASHNLRLFLVVIITIAVLRYAQDVFIPLALAILMTFLLAPLVDLLQRWRVNRLIAVVIAVGVAIALIGGLIYVVIHQFTDLVGEFPRYRRQLRANLAEFSGMLRGGVHDTTAAVEQLTREIRRVAPTRTVTVPKVQIVPPPADAMTSLREFVGPIIKPLGTAAVVIVFVIFMLLRLPDLRDRIIRLAGPQNLRATMAALGDAARRVSRFLLMQT